MIKLVLLFLPLLFASSSALFPKYPIVDNHKIRSGSSLSPSPDNILDKNHWLSPSGNFAFGFYPLCSDCDNDPSPSYRIGIWLVKSSSKTLVWVANPNDPPLTNLSTIFFDYDGKLVLQTKTRKNEYDENVVGKERLLFPEVGISAAYAKMHDNGNFVLYSYGSGVIWESFDHPTDTILGGQQLHGGQILRANGSITDHHGYKRTYWLGIEEEEDGNVVIRHSESKDSTTERVPLTLNLDPVSGRLYLVDGNDMVLQNITRGDERRDRIDSNVIYRAKLYPDGNLRLYMERFEGEGGESILLWYSPLKDNSITTTELRVLCFIITIFLPSVGAFFYLIWPKTDQHFEQHHKDAAAARSLKMCN